MNFHIDTAYRFIIVLLAMGEPD